MAINRVIAKTGIKRKKGYLYYIDKNGDVREAMMAQYKRDWQRHTSDTMDGLGDVFKWTQNLKKQAHDELLKIANRYEVRQRQRLSNVVYRADGVAQWQGIAHDYSVNMDKRSLHGINRKKTTTKRKSTGSGRKTVKF